MKANFKPNFTRVYWNVCELMYRERDQKNGSMGSFSIITDNAPCHRSLICKFVTQKQSSCLSIFTLLSIFRAMQLLSLPKNKTLLKGKLFDTIPDIQRAKTEQLKALSKEGFQSWIQHWDKCNTC